MYLPPASREWTNSIYNYNTNNVKNSPVYDLNINSLIKGYFSMFFNKKFINKRFISMKKKRLSLNKIFVSKAEVKHTSSKAIVTIYVYNREKLILLKRIRLLKLLITKFILTQTYLLGKYNFNVGLNLENSTNQLMNKLYAKYKMKTRFGRRTTDYSYKILTREISLSLTILRKSMLRLYLNRSKFEENFLLRLGNYIGKYYGKKVEFNIVNLKHISKNVDIFTEIFMLKVKKDGASPVRAMKSLLSKIKIKQVKNSLLERGRVQKTVDYNLIGNKYRNNTLSVILENSSNPGYTNSILKGTNSDGINNILNDIYFKSSENLRPQKGENLNLVSSTLRVMHSPDHLTDNLIIRNIILDNIKYKESGGAKLEVKGRLTKRYRADRALYKFKWKGGLKNIDSAFKGLRTMVYRGYRDVNVEKSLLVSKRRIGSFAVKGWLSTK